MKIIIEDSKLTIIPDPKSSNEKRYLMAVVNKLTWVFDDIEVHTVAYGIRIKGQLYKE